MKALGALFILWFISFGVYSQIPPKLKFEHDTLFFEPIIDGEKVELDFNFKVISEDAIHIHQVYPGCSCTTPIYSDDTLKPNEAGKVKIIYNSAGWGTDTGYLLEKHVYVLYNGGSQVVFFQGRVHSKDTVSKIRFDTLVHDFGIIPMGAPVNYAFTFINQNLNPVNIKMVRTSGGKLISTWSREPIAFNQMGVINAQLTATSIGTFNKKLSVETNLGTIILTVKGIVEP